MAFIQKSVEVRVPVSVAYDQWTQFEEFPRFMAGVEAVEQRDDRHLHWRVRIGGERREWDAEITEQIPAKRIAWRSTGGVANAGVLTFHHVGDDRSRVALQLEYDPRDWKENAARLLGMIDREVTRDLRAFKAFIEQRGAPTGASHLQVSRPEDRPRPAAAASSTPSASTPPSR